MDPVIEQAIRREFESELTKADLDDEVDGEVWDIDLEDLAKLQQLKDLHLDNTKVTKAGVAELKKELPNCIIGH